MFKGKVKMLFRRMTLTQNGWNTQFQTGNNKYKTKTISRSHLVKIIMSHYEMMYIIWKALRSTVRDLHSKCYTEVLVSEI